MKTCTCQFHKGERLVPETFFTSKLKKNTCKDCLSIIRKREREKNKVRVQREQSNWRKLNEAYIKQYGKEYRESEQGRKVRQASYERNREQKRQYDRNRWKTDPVNRAKRLAAAAKYRASKLQATPKWFEQERRQIEEVYFQAALITHETLELHDVDHIVPLQGENVCGLHTLCNLQILLKKKNQSKKNKW